MATIRLATIPDAAAVAAVYAPYCDATVISFEETAPTADEMARRIASIGATLPWIVLEDDGGVIGFAYASAHNERAAYRWSVSTAIYIARSHHRRGAGRALYTTLFALLQALGYRQATAWWRLEGWWASLRRRRAVWGTMTRQGLGSTGTEEPGPA